MRKTSLSISKTRVNGVLFWQVTVPKLGGGRERKTFRKHDDAETYFNNAKIQQENHGVAGLAIKDSLRVQAVECAAKLAEFGKSIVDATDYYLAHLKAVTSSKKVSEVVADLLRAQEADGASVRYVGDLRARLNKFAVTFGEEMIATLAPRQISEWLRGLGVAGLTRNTFRLRLAALFSFAKRSGYVTTNPIENVEKAKESSAEIEILSVEQVKELLSKASKETLPYWALGAFSGLRSAEIERLDWEDIDLEGGHVEVRASKSKTASRRLVPIQDNLRAWLMPYRAAKGRICPIGLRVRLLADRKEAELLVNWGNNALRHSYGSYRLPVLGDAARLALEMGNSPQMIFQHYRELVKPTAAAEYWKIAPKAKKKAERKVKGDAGAAPTNVVPMTAAA